MRRHDREAKFSRISLLAVVFNALQIICAAALFIYALVTEQLKGAVEWVVLGAFVLIVVSGAVTDILDSIEARKVGAEGDMLEDALGQLEGLNGTLRKQRHDFLNHLQVVFGLIELDQKEEAAKYIETIYGDIRSVSYVMKTALPALNALLSAKLEESKRSGVELRFDILSDWADIDVPAWELCRVLGNLLDNAIYAAKEGGEAGSVTLALSESISEWSYSVSDNGTGIAPENVDKVFGAGFTTKKHGHGMGLSIVKDIAAKYKGTIGVGSADELTVFKGTFPKTRDGEKGTMTDGN